MRETSFSFIALVLFVALGAAGVWAAGQIKGLSFDSLGPTAVPYAVSIMVILLSLACAFFALRSKKEDSDTSDVEENLDIAEKTYGTRDTFEVLAMLGIVVVYVLALFYIRVPFSIATSLLLPAVSCLLERSISLRMTMLALAVGAFIGVGGELLFTKIFFIDLPTVW